MQANVLLSYVPTSVVHDLREKFGKDEHGNNKLKTIRFFLDLKNFARTLFIQDVCYEMLNTSSTMAHADTTIFQSILHYIGFWKGYCKRTNINCEIYISSDHGKSIYHRGILNTYKQNRDISFCGLPESVGNEFIRIRNHNFEFANKVVNKFKNVYFINLPQLESDFVPHYLLTRVLENDDSYLNLLFSNDKDHFQTLCLAKNIFMLYKTNNGAINCLSRSMVLPKFVGVNANSANLQNKLNVISKISPEYISAIMAVIGDQGDDVPGIKGLGPGKVAKMFSDETVVQKLIGTLQDAINRVHEGGHMIKDSEIPLSHLHKDWQTAIQNNDIVTTAFKLINYELLCKWVDNVDILPKKTWKKILCESKNKVENLITLNEFAPNFYKLQDAQLETDDLNKLFI